MVKMNFINFMKDHPIKHNFDWKYLTLSSSFLLGVCIYITYQIKKCVYIYVCLYNKKKHVYICVCGELSW